MSPLQLSDYQADWPLHVESLAARLRAALPGLQLEHIGSTAVPGLCAKPVLDLLLGATTLAEIEAQAERLAGLGFRYRPDVEAALPERRYFVRDADAVLPRVHLHGVRRGGRLWRQQLGFRDLLRGDAALRDEYAALKRRLAAVHADDKAAYQEAKAPFIAACLARLAPCLHFFGGKPGAGKTTRATALAREQGLPLISEDICMQRLYGDQLQRFDDYIRLAPKLRAVIGPLSTELLQAGQSLVLDFQANTRAGRRWFLALAEAAGAAHCLHWLDAPDALCLQRIAQRNLALPEGAHALSEAVFHEVCAHIETPTPDEGLSLRRTTDTP